MTNRQPLPGVLWRGRVGPVKASKPHMPLTVPVSWAPSGMGGKDSSGGRGGGLEGGGAGLGVAVEVHQRAAGGVDGGSDGYAGGREGEGRALLRGGGDEAALEGVGDEWDVGVVAGDVEVEDEVVGEVGGVDEGGHRRGRGRAWAGAGR